MNTNQMDSFSFELTESAVQNLNNFTNVKNLHIPHAIDYSLQQWTNNKPNSWVICE